jgi:hypothetical protein
MVIIPGGGNTDWIAWEDHMAANGFIVRYGQLADGRIGYQVRDEFGTAFRAFVQLA